MPGEVASIALMAENLSPRERVPEVAALSALAVRARAGDAEAFDQIMICTQHKIAATAWRMLGSREDARDATQEAYLRAYKYLNGYRPEQDFHGWLYRIAVNVCRDMLRARRGFETAMHSPTLDEKYERSLVERIPGGADTEEAAVLAQKRAIVSRGLETLPEKERTAVILRDLEGLSTEEVSRLMNTRPATVRSQVSTARAKLKLYCERIMQGRRN
jgi:RNA polymerase sigma-70 factor, ECF subfamily